MNLYGHRIDPYWRTCLACSAPDCKGTDSPTCPLYGVPLPAEDRTCGDADPETPFPSVLSAAVVETRSGCRHCLAITDCAASVRHGGPALCERCGFTTIGREARMVEV